MLEVARLNLKALEDKERQKAAFAQHKKKVVLNTPHLRNTVLYSTFYTS